MADWNNPLLSTAYATFLSNMKDRDVNALTLLDSRLSAGSNLPTRAKRWNNTDMIFEDWDGAAWQDVVIGILGGGTGAGTAAGARSNLGLGTMATQAASAVAITGGTIADVTMSFTSDGNKNIGSNANGLGKIYIHGACVIPVGADAYTAS